MKRLIIILLVLGASTIVNAQAYVDDVFSKYAGQPGFTSVHITPQLFNLLSMLDSEDADLKILSKNLKSLKILVSEEKSIGFTKEVNAKIGKENFLNIMEIIDGKQKVNFYVKQKEDVITDFILLSIDDTEEVLISITGNLKLNELSKLGKNKSFDSKNGHLSLLKSLEGK
jgi:hypothetical protein